MVNRERHRNTETIMLVLQQTETETWDCFAKHPSRACCIYSMGIAAIPAYPDWLSIAVNPASIQDKCCNSSMAFTLLLLCQRLVLLYMQYSWFAAFASRSDCLCCFCVICCNSSTPNLRIAFAANITSSLGG